MLETIFETKTKIVGVTRDNRQELLEELSEYDEIKFVREPNNPHDPNAIAVLNPDGEKLGYIRAGLAKDLVAYMELYPDSILVGEILEITGDEVGKNYGCNIEITLIKPYDHELISKYDHALISKQFNTNATYAVILFVLGSFTLVFSAPAFAVASLIGVFVLLIAVAFFATGAYLLKFSFALEKSLSGRIVQKTRENQKKQKVKVLIWIFALVGILLVVYGIVSILS